MPWEKQEMERKKFQNQEERKEERKGVRENDRYRRQAGKTKIFIKEVQQECNETEQSPKMMKEN